MEIGLYTLSELVADPATGERVSAHRRLRETIAAAKLADEAGLDVFGVGEHHRLDYAVSSPAVMLGAIASVTSQIRLASAVTVLGAADPVRLFEDFATLDLLSDGRAELMLGRGAFGEPFELAGIPDSRYDSAFVENFHLLQAIGAQERVTWSGSSRPALINAAIAPRPLQERIPAWIAVGGSPESVQRAGRLGAPLVLAALGGSPRNFIAPATSYRAAGAAAGHASDRLRIAIAAHTYVGATSKAARDEFYPFYINYWAQALGTPHPFGSLSRSDFEKLAAPDTMLMVGSSQEVVDKILLQHELLGHDRFLAQIDIGAQPFPQVARTIERLAVEVAPKVRAATKKSTNPEIGTPRDITEAVG